jgi:CMP/dCMP kinase
VTRHWPVVAIDGPAGAGKSTVTRRVAQRLGYRVLDTGALYRSVALAAKRAGTSFDDDRGVSAIARDLSAHNAVDFVADEAGGQKVWLRGEDVTLAIRTQETSDGASRVSALPGVRAALLDLQRAIGRNGGVVVEGRDIGSVVFPDAEAKFFLTATAEERARRRHAELEARGYDVGYDTILLEVRERDTRDMSRSVAPLVQALDACVVDSTHLSIDEVVDQIVSQVAAVADKLKAQSR